MAKLLLKFNAAVIKEISLEKTPLTIGRKPDNDVQIDNMAVSGHHARVLMQGSAYVIEDLQSTNGTFINDKKIITSAIRHNDSILIGQHTLVFIHPEEQQAPDAPAPVHQQPVDSEATIVVAPAAAQPAKETTGAPTEVPALYPPREKNDSPGILTVIEGKLDQVEYALTGLLTYIGKSETAAIRIKGLFAPDIAALISRRPNGYLITAVKEGYPKLNGTQISGQVDLKDGDIIEVGGAKLMLSIDAGQQPEKTK